MTSRRKRPLSAEEEALWKAATRNDRPLTARNVRTPPDPPRSRRRPMTAPEALDFGSGEDFGKSPKALRPGGSEIDGNLASRLKRGLVPIDGTIDLHGLTLREAEDRLGRYVAGAIARGSRCILVITGKGALPPEPHERDYMPEWPRPGAIRANLKSWLQAGPFAGQVLAVQPAQPKHGGSGAYYVLLRRRREA